MDSFHIVEFQINFCIKKYVSCRENYNSVDICPYCGECAGFPQKMNDRQILDKCRLGLELQSDMRRRNMPDLFDDAPNLNDAVMFMVPRNMSGVLYVCFINVCEKCHGREDCRKKLPPACKKIEKDLFSFLQKLKTL
jgi:hypothetical protein